MKQKLSRFILCTSVLAITLCGCGSTKEEPKKEEKKAEEKIKLMKNDLYTEPLKPSNAQIKAFNKLTNAVDEADYKEEAKMAAVSFAFDFFTLSNKSSCEDVGGLQFIPKIKLYRFKEFAQAYYYNNYGTIVNEYGKDALPQVTSYKVNSIEAAQLMYNEHEGEGYVVNLKLNYAKSDIPKEKLKQNMTITMISISDYPFDRSKTYKDDADFSGDRIDAYRVLSVED